MQCKVRAEALDWECGRVNLMRNRGKLGKRTVADERRTPASSIEKNCSVPLLSEV
jgi:hypothetical protein